MRGIFLFHRTLWYELIHSTQFSNLNQLTERLTMTLTCVSSSALTWRWGWYSLPFSSAQILTIEAAALAKKTTRKNCVLMSRERKPAWIFHEIQTKYTTHTSENIFLLFMLAWELSVGWCHDVAMAQLALSYCDELGNVCRGGEHKNNFLFYYFIL